MNYADKFKNIVSYFFYMKFRIFTTEEFNKKFSKLDKNIQRQIDNEIEQLETNPNSGKPLGYKFFREKKVRNYRFYYLIYEEYIVVFIITMSEKKDQQEAIDKIKGLIPFYRDEIERKLNL